MLPAMGFVLMGIASMDKLSMDTDRILMVTAPMGIALNMEHVLVDSADVVVVGMLGTGIPDIIIPGRINDHATFPTHNQMQRVGL